MEASTATCPIVNSAPRQTLADNVTQTPLSAKKQTSPVSKESLSAFLYPAMYPTVSSA